MVFDKRFPETLQYHPTQRELDESVAQAKGVLLNDIKRSIYVYRVDCGGCNGCEIEIFASIMPVFDVERFGIKVVATPAHADIMLCTGAVTRSMRMPAIRAYDSIPDPKLVISYGACGNSGGIFHDNYCVWGGTDKLFPVDVYIPGCPPTPHQTIFGFAMALGLLEQKLHAEHYEEVEGEQAFIRHGAVPYKLRSAIEKEARLMAGYKYGKALSTEFIQAMTAGDEQTIGRMDFLIADTDDPRKAEIFRALKDVVSAHIVGEVAE